MLHFRAGDHGGADAVVSRNVARAGDAHASRKTANVVTAPGGGVRLASVTRASNQALFEKMLAATTERRPQKAIVDALSRLDATNNDPELDASPAAQVAKFAAALQQYAQAPQDATLARSAVSGRERPRQLPQQRDQDRPAGARPGGRRHCRFGCQPQRPAGAVRDRQHADQSGQRRAGADVTDDLDQRDQILAEHLRGDRRPHRHPRQQRHGDLHRQRRHPVRYAPRGGHVRPDAAVSCHRPPARRLRRRRADHRQHAACMASELGPHRRADARCAIRSPSPTRASSTRLRAGWSRRFRRERPERHARRCRMCRLFTWSGAPAMPVRQRHPAGMAGTIRVNASVDPAQGGNPTRLRDGAHLRQPGLCLQRDRRQRLFRPAEQLLDGLDAAAQPSMPTAEAGIEWAPCSSYAASSVAWLQAARKSASDDADYKSTLLSALLRRAVQAPPGSTSTRR